MPEHHLSVVITGGDAGGVGSVPGFQPSHAPTPATADTMVATPISRPRFRQRFHHDSSGLAGSTAEMVLVLPLEAWFVLTFSVFRFPLTM